jgi:SAM-dependent methyltransferase
MASDAFSNASEITDGGERVTHLERDPAYYAHLSIYDFAAKFCANAVVLDAGSGAGYGAARLIEHGAREVTGLEASEKAVVFSRHHFQKPGLSFRTLKIDEIGDAFPDQYFDLIFSSNVLEHVKGVGRFLFDAHRMLKLDGAMVIAVPPIMGDRLIYLNLINPYHVNIWTPHQWSHTLGLYFRSVQPVLHGVTKIGADFSDISTPAGELTEKDFPFAEGALHYMYSRFSLTSVFVVREPRPSESIPDRDAAPSFVDESFSRSVGTISVEQRLRFKRFFDMPAPPFTRPISQSGFDRLRTRLKRGANVR